MRIVVLSSNIYSERALATIVSLSEAGHKPAACLCVSTVNLRYLIRKFGQYGILDFFKYAVRRLGLAGGSGDHPGKAKSTFENPFIEERLKRAGVGFTKVSEACRAYQVPIIFCSDMHEPKALERLRKLSPDLGVYTGGGILRRPLIETFKVGILNAHAGVLPHYRGMSVAEWALLTGGETGLTVHFIDPGIDTGGVLFVRKIPVLAGESSLSQFRHRLGDATIEALVEGTEMVHRQNFEPIRQSAQEGKQYFVMHQRLVELAERRLRAAARNSSRVA
jgi:folate-dependent phosphoribosylglycinamide formyltransferase PurN